MKFETYTQEQLPDNFKYPDKYLNFSKNGEYKSISPWWFIDALSEVGKLFLSVCLNNDDNLIPFAKDDGFTDDVTCFDGNDQTREP